MLRFSSVAVSSLLMVGRKQKNMLVLMRFTVYHKIGAKSNFSTILKSFNKITPSIRNSSEECISLHSRLHPII